MLTRSHRRIIETVDALAEAATAGDEDAEALAVMTDCVAFLLDQGHRHELDEEQSFFPRLRGRIDRGLLEALSADHRAHESLARDLDAILSGPLGADERNTARQIVKDLRASFHSHVAREESELWPAILSAMSEQELSEALNEMHARRGR